MVSFWKARCSTSGSGLMGTLKLAGTWIYIVMFTTVLHKFEENIERLRKVMNWATVEAELWTGRQEAKTETNHGIAVRIRMIRWKCTWQLSGSTDLHLMYWSRSSRQVFRWSLHGGSGITDAGISVRGRNQTSIKVNIATAALFV